LEGKKVFIATVGWNETLLMGTFLGFAHGTGEPTLIRRAVSRPLRGASVKNLHEA
jgi:hypothetical protein